MDVEENNLKIHIINFDLTLEEKEKLEEIKQYYLIHAHQKLNNINDKDLNLIKDYDEKKLNKIISSLNLNPDFKDRFLNNVIKLFITHEHLLEEIKLKDNLRATYDRAIYQNKNLHSSTLYKLENIKKEYLEFDEKLAKKFKLMKKDKDIYDKIDRLEQEKLKYQKQASLYKRRSKYLKEKIIILKNNSAISDLEDD